MTLQVDFDRDLWVYVPTDWPWEQFATLEQWRDALVRALGDAYGYDEPMREWLAATLDGLSRGADPEEHRFAYLARPHEVIGIASIYELEAAPETSLHELLGVEDDAVARPVEGQTFVGGRLGDGHTATRHVIDEDGAINVVAHWVWRLPDRDVVMIVGDFDLARFETLRADYEALARAIGTAD